MALVDFNTSIAFTSVSDQFGNSLPLNFSNGQITISTATPVPAALPLFATGLGALALLGWRKKRKARSVAA